MSYNLAERLQNVRMGDQPVAANVGQTLQHVDGQVLPPAMPRSAPDVRSGESLTPGAVEWARLLADPLFDKVKGEVLEHLSRTEGLAKDEADRRLLLRADAQAGAPLAEQELKTQIEQLVTEKSWSVPGVDRLLMVDALFEALWGLDVLSLIYRDNTVEEIRVNSHQRVYTLRYGKPYHEPIQFRSPEHVRQVMRRILLADRLDITRDQPRVETTRKDGARVTGAMPPFTEFPTIVIRKFNTMEISPEAFLGKQTINPRMLNLLRLLVQGRASLLLSGGTGTGKTHFLRMLVGFLPDNLRIVTLESDRELGLLRYYPQKDIVALEEHKELNPPLTLAEAFKTVLRFTPDVVILGESRAGEAEEMVKAAMRGHDGSMGTVHVSSAREAIEAMCNMILEERPHRPIEVLRAQVSTAFNVIVQMVRWPSGQRIVAEICEISYDHDQRKVIFNTICKWKGSEDNVEVGDWEFPNAPSAGLIERLKRGGVPGRELREAGMLV